MLTSIITDSFPLLFKEILDVRLMKSDDFFELVIRFAFNTVIVLILVRWLYYSISQRKDYLFSYLIIGSVVFLLCYLLENVKLELGFALGLFAIFGIIRYRTRQIPIKEMTYLFLIIGVSVINALTNRKVSYAELFFTNFILIFITYALEKLWLLRHEATKVITYEKINLIKPEFRAQLIEDLQERTGIPKINRVEVGAIDFLRDTARIKIYYYDQDYLFDSADEEERGSSNNDEE